MVKPEAKKRSEEQYHNSMDLLLAILKTLEEIKEEMVLESRARILEGGSG